MCRSEEVSTRRIASECVIRAHVVDKRLYVLVHLNLVRAFGVLSWGGVVARRVMAPIVPMVWSNRGNWDLCWWRQLGWSRCSLAFAHEDGAAFRIDEHLVGDGKPLTLWGFAKIFDGVTKV
jgi:hypothetical protein